MNMSGLELLEIFGMLATGNGKKLIKATSNSLFTLVFAKFANFV